MKYSVEYHHSAPMALALALRLFRSEAARFAEACRRCPRYGTSWTCPPFATPPEQLLARYRHVTFYVAVVTPSEPLLLRDTQALVRPVRLEVDRRLRQLEQPADGYSLSYVGSCLYCPDGRCTRAAGGACRHPELVRPSLEAWGFDIAALLRHCFGMELLWGEGGYAPSRLTLVSALLHNNILHD